MWRERRPFGICLDGLGVGGVFEVSEGSFDLGAELIRLKDTGAQICGDGHAGLCGAEAQDLRLFLIQTDRNGASLELGCLSLACGCEQLLGECLPV